MELKEFIKQTLKNIVEGVSETQSELNNVEVLPKLVNDLEIAKAGFSNIQKIDYEVSLNVIERKGSEAKINVVTAIIGGGFKGNKSNSSEHSAKLSFSVPIKYNTLKKK